MKFLVCLKKVGSDGELDRFDAHALEEALRLKERLAALISKPVTVDAVTAGPEDAAAVIRRAFGLGVDRGFHIVTEETEYIAPRITAGRLAAGAGKTAYDLILTGIMSSDLMAAQTGPMLARLMNLPCVTGVVKTEIKPKDKIIEVERELENGRRYLLEIDLPALITIQAGINSLRYPKLSTMLAAAKKEIITIRADELETTAAREIYLGQTEPQKTLEGRRLTGSLADQVRQFNTILKKKNIL